MRADDAETDALYETYLRARSKGAKQVALANLLTAAEPFIGRVVKHFSHGPIRDLEPDDAMQHARIGYLEAVKRADPKIGPLRPYAMARIRHELQSLAEVSYGIKIPRRSGMPAHVLRGIEKIWSKDGREPTPQELNGHAQAYAEAANRPRVVTSFDAPAPAGPSLAESLGSDSPNALDLLLDKERFQRSRPARSLVRVTSHRKPSPMPAPPAPESKKNPLEQLEAAIQSLHAYLGELADKEAAIHKERESIRSTLAKLTSRVPLPPAPPAASRVILALGQDRLPHRVVGYLKEHPSARIAAIAEALGEDTETVGATLIKLREKGVVRTTGKARGTTYDLAS